MMRILLLSQFYPPDFGGIEHHVHALAHRLAEKGHTVAVATFACEGDASVTDDDGVEVHRVGGLARRIGTLHATDRRHAPPVPDPETVLALRRVVHTFEPEVVHAHNWIGRSFLPLKRSSGARYVVSLHDCGRTCAQGRMMYRGEQLCERGEPRDCIACTAAYYGSLKGLLTFEGNEMVRSFEKDLVDLYLPVSRAIAEVSRLTEAGVPYEVVPNFAEDSAQRRRTPKGDRLPDGIPDAPFLLQVGDLLEDKGVGVLLDAYDRLGEERPPLVLAGRDDGRFGREWPAGVISTGPLPHDVVAELWRRSLFGTMPSLCLDASPTVTLEAMAASRPVVASARGGLLDQVVDGETGFLVPPGDSGALASAMARLLADERVRARLGAAARERFEREFSASVVISRIESIYARLLTSEARPFDAAAPATRPHRLAGINESPQKRRSRNGGA